ncbi:hypothetical protein P775_00715 [Puniceibacterium antarcticum]|uniref:Uncharacterized protein n=1 Tax=Puniceibacterium antarcticum TaxID=1206336 RepID=A0A2G8RKN0_9RHOB|nr:hypothetical protein P775_00715 [Puniceibacterium antarcticum]
MTDKTRKRTTPKSKHGTQATQTKIVEDTLPTALMM